MHHGPAIVLVHPLVQLGVRLNTFDTVIDVTEKPFAESTAAVFVPARASTTSSTASGRMTTFPIIVAESVSWHRPRKCPNRDLPQSCACVDQVRLFANLRSAKLLWKRQCDPKGLRQAEVVQAAAIRVFGEDRDAYLSPHVAINDRDNRVAGVDCPFQSRPVQRLRFIALFK